MQVLIVRRDPSPTPKWLALSLLVKRPCCMCVSQMKAVMQNKHKSYLEHLGVLVQLIFDCREGPFETENLNKNTYAIMF